MAVGTAALIGLTATAVAKPDSFKGMSELTALHGNTHKFDFGGGGSSHSGSGSGSPGFGAPSGPHNGGSPSGYLPASYADKKDDHQKQDGKSEHEKHQGYQAPDQIEAFQDFWRDTESFAQRCVESVWPGIASHHDDDGKKSGKSDGGYTPVNYGPDRDKPDHHAGPGKPDWSKPDKPDKTDWASKDWPPRHNHDKPDKPGYHVPRPDCEEPIQLPEPNTLPLLGAGLMGAWLLLRRRNKLSRAD